VSSVEKIDRGLPRTRYGFTAISVAAEQKAIELEEKRLDGEQKKLDQERLKKTDPKTGKTQKYERKIEPETPPESPEVELITEQIKGQANLKPIGWNPYVAKTEVYSVGFLPSKGVADSLAAHIAQREVARRDGLIVTMPIPIEWVQAGCPPFAIAYLHDTAVLMDAPIIEIKDGRMALGFTGERLGSIPPVANTTPTIKPITPVVRREFEQMSRMVRSAELVDVEAIALKIIRSVELISPTPIALPLVRDAQLIPVEAIALPIQRRVELVAVPSPIPLALLPLVRDMQVIETEVLGVKLERSATLLTGATGSIGLTAIAHWSMDSSAWVDSIGSADLTQTGTVDLVDGRIGNAAEFQYLGSLRTDDPAFSAAVWMISFKCRRTEFYSTDVLIRRWDGTAIEWEIVVQDAEIMLRVWNTTNTNYDEVRIAISSDTSWNVVFVELTATELKVTINGIAASTPLTVTPAQILNSTDRLEFSGGRCCLDDVIFYT
jgi:hypothetical protein